MSSEILSNNNNKFVLKIKIFGKTFQSRVHIQTMRGVHNDWHKDKYFILKSFINSQP